MTTQTLRLLFASFPARTKEITAFKNKIRNECGIAYPTLENYSSPTKKTKIPKLVGEKIMEIVKRDYPEKAELLEQFEEVA